MPGSSAHVNNPLRVLLLASAVLATSCAVTGDPPETTAAEKRQILLTLKQADPRALRLAGPPGKSYLKRRGYRSSPATERTLDQIAKQYELERVDGWPIRSLGVYCEVFGLGEGQELDGLVGQLAEDPRVDSVQAMNTFEVLAQRYDDPYFELQAGIHTLNVSSAHRWASGKGVTVAVVDTAVDHTHPDLKDQVLLSRDFVLDSKAADGAGDIHGTAVAGIIASGANNHTGIVGVAPNVRVLALKACWPVTPNSTAARCSSFTLAKAIEFAVNARAQVLNLSLTGPTDPLLSRLVSGAIDKGMVVVTAKPPGGSEGFPVSVPDVIAVASADDPKREGSPAFGASRVAAPGHNILTTAPNSSYEFLSGSSLAAAHVSGITALLLEMDHMLTSRRVGELLAASGRGGEGLVLVDACEALAQVVESADCGARFADADASGQ